MRRSVTSISSPTSSTPTTNENKDKNLIFKRNFQTKFSESDIQTDDGGVGYRSPCVSLQQYQGSTSPAAQGRSVREFEEQMATLRKENFNLKLRLYFIEESIPGYQQANSADGQETLMKQLIDTKVEMEILRKEIQEKQDILKEAAQAMNQMERIQKETEAKSQAIADELNQKIQFLEMEKEMEKSQNGEFMNELLGRSDISENINAIQRIRELEGIVKQSEEKLNDFQDQISKLDEILQKRDETIKEYEEKVKEIVFQNAELLEALENKEKEVTCAESKRLREELQTYKSLLADKTCMLQEAEEQIKNRTQIHEKACRTIQKLMINISNQQEEIKRLKTNTSQVTEDGKQETNVSRSGLSGLDCSGLCKSMSDSEACNMLSPSQKQKYESTIADQETLIRSLKADIKKKTANLQNLVNKELWEKNREIERLTKLINKNTDGTAALSPTKDHSAHELQQSFSETDYLKALERNKLLQKKVDILIQRLSVDRNNEALITQLRNDVRDARHEAEHAEKWRRECADVCSVLSNRLEELANFLNSLLKHKDVLGMLAADRRKAMRKAVDRSLDLSKSLNMTLSITGVSMIDQSLLQLSNLSGILGDDAETENKTFNSHEDLQAQVQSMETLKAENKALKQELDHRRSNEAIRSKERRSLPLGCVDNQSESEAWSEPDRKVSMARIGLDDHSSSMPKSSAVSAAVTKVKAVKMATDSESDILNQSRSSKTPQSAPSRSSERIAQLEQLIAQRDDRILDIQCQLVEADSRLKKEHLKVMDMTNELEQLRQRNEELHADLLAIGSEADQNLKAHDQSMLQRQIAEKTRSIEKIQEERDRIAIEARVAEIQIAALRTDIEDMKRKHKLALTQTQEQERQKLEKLQVECNILLEARLTQQLRQHEETLERDWIARSLYTESQQQLKKLQNQLKETQSHIEYLQENEEEMKQTLVDSELALRAIKKQLDESTMQASKAVLERTRALNEKLQLEKRVQELSTEQKQHEAERSTLRHKIEQLESMQTTLQQQLEAAHAKAQKLQGSDVSQSGYTSEDVPLIGAGGNASGASTAAPRLNNSSPDLGIESDAGRVLSVELSSAEHKRLKAVELQNSKIETTDANDAATAANKDVKPSNLQQLNTAPANGPHDCAKVDQENIELRRKVNRTKRALEDAYEKLRISNQRKAQVEKDIKNQILKTHNVLRNVRSNMENEL